MRHLLIVVGAADAAAANARARLANPEGGNWFDVPLSASGAAPATHYWCGVSLDDAEESGFRSLLASAIAAGRARVFVTREPGQSETAQRKDPEQALAALGLRRIGWTGPRGGAPGGGGG
jgi:hypothetical protein